MLRVMLFEGEVLPERGVSQGAETNSISILERIIG